MWTRPKYPNGVRKVADRMTQCLAMPSDRWDEILYWLNEAYKEGVEERDNQTKAYINKMAKKG
jgi:hypothetical protein